MEKSKMIRHGELVLVPVPEMKLKGFERKTNYVASHSETGHHHVIEGDCMVLEREGLDTLVAIEEDTTIRHKKADSKHDDLQVRKGIYRLLKKREYDPFRKVMREVWD
jgi:hypothetical protein